jgi:vitamin B12 transporter
MTQKYFHIIFLYSICNISILFFNLTHLYSIDNNESNQTIDSTNPLLEGEIQEPNIEQQGVSFEYGIKTKKVVVSAQEFFSSVNYTKKISKDEISQSKAINLIDLLEQQSNINLSQNSGGSVATIKMNGSFNGNVLVLIDGVKISDPSGTQSAYDLSSLPTSFIEEVEIIQGSSSVAYGSSANFGVINIKTKKNNAPKDIFTKDYKGNLNAFVNQELGSYNTTNTKLGISYDYKNFSSFIVGNMFSTQGYSLTKNTTTPDLPLDNDGYNYYDITAKLSYTLDNKNYVDILTRQNSGKNEYDGFEYNSYSTQALNYIQVDKNYYTTHKENFSYVQIGTTTGSIVDHHIAFSKLVLVKEFFSDYNAIYESKEDNISYDATIYPNKYITTKLGVDLSNQKMTDSSNLNSYFPHSFDISYYSIFKEQLNKNLEFTQGIRFNGRTLEQPATQQSYTAYNLGVSQNLVELNTLIKINYSQGYRMPSLYELYSDFGNPVLEPEYTKNITTTFEIYNFSNDIDFINVNFFYNDIKDLIVFKNLYGNDGDYTSYGTTLDSLILLSENLFFKPSYTYTYAQNKETGTMAPNLPQHKVNAGLSYTKKSYNITLNTTYYSQTLDLSSGNAYYLSPYTLVNLAGSYNITKNMEAYLKLNNLLNKEYEVYKGYERENISLYLGFNYKTK